MQCSKPDDRRAGKPAPVNDGSVIQLIGKNQIFFSDQGRNGGHIRIKARLKRNGGLDPLETGELFFKLRVKNHGSGNGTDRRRPDAELLNRILSRLL